jgi:hypothetical protein
MLTEPDLLALVEKAHRDDLPRLAGAFETARAAAWARLLTPPTAPAPGPTDAADRFITPLEAAAIADVKVARIYEWARGRKWATRPTRRCLRIAEQGFRRWLQAKGA